MKKARSKNEEVVRVVEKMKKADEWQIERELVLKESKVYVLKDEKLRADIIWLHHDILVVGHGRK